MTISTKPNNIVRLFSGSSERAVPDEAQKPLNQLADQGIQEITNSSWFKEKYSNFFAQHYSAKTQPIIRLEPYADPTGAEGVLVKVTIGQHELTAILPKNDRSSASQEKCGLNNKTCEIALKILRIGKNLQDWSPPKKASPKTEGPFNKPTRPFRETGGGPTSTTNTPAQKKPEPHTPIPSEIGPFTLYSDANITTLSDLFMQRRRNEIEYDASLTTAEKQEKLESVALFTPINNPRTMTEQIYSRLVQDALEGVNNRKCYLIPLNLGVQSSEQAARGKEVGAHWVVVAFEIVPGTDPDPGVIPPDTYHITYFDPFGAKTMPKDILPALQRSFPRITAATPIDYSTEKLQTDNYNCGVWCEEFMRTYVTEKRALKPTLKKLNSLPSGSSKSGIEAARARHAEEILKERAFMLQDERDRKSKERATH